jgi:hypothetical protein
MLDLVEAISRQKEEDGHVEDMNQTGRRLGKSQMAHDHQRYRNELGQINPFHPFPRRGRQYRFGTGELNGFRSAAVGSLLVIHERPWNREGVAKSVVILWK